MKKSKPEITEIMISEEKLAEYQTRIKGNPKSPIQLSRQGKVAITKEYLGGACCICSNIPTKIVKYNIVDESGASKLIERYCQSCFEKQELTDNNKVKLLDTGQRNEAIALKTEWKRSNKYDQ